MRALCEAPQMMLHYADIPYKYKMVWDHYGSSWAEVKKDIIFNRLPILIINEDKYDTESYRRFGTIFFNSIHSIPVGSC